MALIWLGLWLPQLALDGVMRQRAESGPLVLVDGPVNGRYLLAVNPAADKLGLRIGQRLSAAQVMCSGFDVVVHDPAQQLQSHTMLAEVAYRYSSEVYLLPEALVLEVGRSQGLFGHGRVIAERLCAELDQLGFQHQWAIAPTPHAACVLAAFRDGSEVAELQYLPAALDPIPLHYAAVSEHSLERLAGMGLRSLGPLLRLPRAGLQRRFGAELIQWLECLLGERPAALPRYQLPQRLDWRLELSHEVEQVAALLFPLRRMTSDLAAMLEARNGGVQQFILHLQHRQQVTQVKVGLLAPACDAGLLFEVARGRLESIQLPAAVLGLRLEVAHLPAMRPQGRDLFEQDAAHIMPFEQLRERLRAKLGDDAVYQLATTTDPRPEYSQQLDRGQPGSVETWPRPTWLLQPAIPLHGPAPRVLAGPERLETGWWDGQAIRRDYYVIETAEGQRGWAYCALDEAEGWMLHGWFA